MMGDKICIIIPFRDKSELLRQCVFSILDRTIYKNYTILLVNNQSQEKKTGIFLEEIKNNEKIKVLNYDKPFNFSAINNFAVKEVKEDYILFLNNDTEVISPNWLDEMLGSLEDERVGAVGAKLLYPNDTIQHCGVSLDEKNLAIHPYRTLKETEVTLENKKEWPAVTGACMLTRRDLFLEVGGFDEENLSVAYNDVDYCLKISELNYKIICVSNIKLYHHESASRKSDIWARIFNRKRYNNFLKEQAYFKTRWDHKLKKRI